MNNATKFFIDGRWVEPQSPNLRDVINPATGQSIGKIAMGSAADVDLAVAAARRAFTSFSETAVDERVELIRRILAEFRRRSREIAEIVTREMGAPISFSLEGQISWCEAQFEAVLEILPKFPFRESLGTTAVIKEPIGVVGLITPWNWPTGQAVAKILPALATGCTMVLKPSEIAPLDAVIFAEILDTAGVPAGVFNLVNGDGATVGEAISRHPGIDMVSFTGSTRAGIQITKAAADTVKRVVNELGGKSANIILDDADIEAAVRGGIEACFINSGQSCDAGTRLLVSRKRYEEAVALAGRYAGEARVGAPEDPGTKYGPLANAAQFEKVQRMIQTGIDEGARLVAGGTGRPDGFEVGYYVRPTVFADVTRGMTIFRDEIFGPVLSIVAYEDEHDAVEIANDTPYGLAAYVSSGDIEHARRIAGKLRAGTVMVNYPDLDIRAPYGGYKQSGNGRENGAYGLSEYLEVKSVLGHG